MAIAVILERKIHDTRKILRLFSNYNQDWNGTCGETNIKHITFYSVWFLRCILQIIFTKVS